MKKSILFSLCFFSLLMIQSVQAQDWWGKGIKGEGPIVTKELDLGKINGIGLGISADVYLTYGSSQSVKVEGQANIIDNLKTRVSGGKWNIGFQERVKNHKSIKIYVTIPNLTTAAVSGSGYLESTNHFPNLDDLEVAVSGSGKVKLDVAASEISTAISGSGDVHLQGSAGKHRIAVSGSGGIQAYNFFSTWAASS